MAPRWRGYAGALPEEWSDAAYQKRIDERIVKAPAGEPVMAGDVFETSLFGLGPTLYLWARQFLCPAPGADSVAFFRIWS